jgi:hypothetical protein
MGVGDSSLTFDFNGIGELANGTIYADGLTFAGPSLIDSPESDPMAFLSWSNDGGNTWSNEYPSSLGRQGKYGKRLIWRNLGMSRNRVYRLAISSSSKKIITGAVVGATT